MSRRSALSGILVIAALFPGAADLAAATPESTHAPRSKAVASIELEKHEHKCGIKHVFERPFAIRVLRGHVNCAKARKIVAQQCALDLKRQWSCLAYREEEPFITWVPTSEVFQQRPITEIVLERYPCSKAWVTRRLFERSSHGFPTRQQMLADDLTRCHLLNGADPPGVISSIGVPDERIQEGRRAGFIYWLGPERASLIQIDQEALLVEFLDDKVEATLIFQG